MLELTRLPEWPERLAAVIVRHRALAFCWGETDCATLLGECVEAVTGVNPVAPHLGWSTRIGAVRALSRAGFASMSDFIGAQLPAIPVSRARRGDLVLPTRHEMLTSPAIVTGELAVSRDEHGWQLVPVAAMAYAWRVG